MSGLVGLFRFDERPVELDELARMTAALSRYGPDGRGLWTPDSTEEPVGLAHLLMRITPEDAFDRQPLIDAARGLALVADARLDNRAELCTELGIAAEQARALPDSALILEAYRQWGEHCPQRLLGAFAFILWDRHARKLVCARDHFGERVLFYHRSVRLFAIASAAKGLLALPEVPRRLNEVKIAEFLVLLEDATASFYQEIVCLPPAHSLTVTAAGTQLRPYWALDSARRLRFRSDAECSEAFHEVFAEAIRCRLRSAYPVGALLSGGLDSSAVTALAARHLKARGQRLATFTGAPREGFQGPAPKGWYNDLTPFIEAIRAWQDNLDVHYIRAEGRTPLYSLDRLFDMLESPVLNPCNRVWVEAIFEALSAQGRWVLLHGQWGNLTISYNGLSLFPELAVQGRWLALIQALRAWAAARQRPLWSAFKGTVLAPLLPEFVWAGYRRWKEGPRPPWMEYSAIHPAFAKETAVAERFRQRGVSLYYRIPVNGRAERIKMATAGSSGHNLLCAWRAGFGVESRDPTADKRVVEFCFAIPQEHYLRDGKSRYLVRRALDGILPPQVVWSTQRGAQAPDWYERASAARGEFTAAIARLERSETACRCLDLPRMRGLLEHWPQGNWADPKVMMEYRGLLLRGMMVGEFIRWFEEKSC